MSDPVIHMRGVTRIFQNGKVVTHAVEQIDIDIWSGDFAAIVGTSGSGKSTLLEIMGLLDPPDKGVYLLRGADTSRMSNRQLSRCRCETIGFVFQMFNLINDVSVLENVRLPLKYRRDSLSTRRQLQEAREALSRVGLSHRMNHMPHQLSGGQQQRVALARAIVTNPAILLLDEPTGNLDRASGDSVIELITELHKSGSTICMVTHDQRYQALANRVYRLNDGFLTNPVADTHNLGKDASLCSH